MEDELILSSSLSQPAAFETEDIKTRVREIVDKSLEAKNPEIAFNAGITLMKAHRLAGRGLAELIYQMHSHWNDYQIGAEFEDVAMQYWEMDKTILSRYLRVAEMHASGEVPEEIAQVIDAKPMKDQIAIATAWVSGFPIKDEQWQELADAPNNSAVLQKLREVKDEPPRRNALSIRLERDGTLRVWSEGEGHYLGYLAIEDRQEKAAIDRAINRIVNLVGIEVE